MDVIVSICIPTYQQPALVERAVESVFQQDFHAFELIVTDDSESDVVARVLDRWISDPRVKYFHNSVRLGSPANWNKALSLCAGKYIKFVHHDDWFSEPGSLKHFVAAMDGNPEATLACSATYACKAGGNEKLRHRVAPARIQRVITRPDDLIFGNIIGAPSATIFRTRPDFRFDEKLKWVVDIDAYIRLLDAGHLVYIPDPLMCVTMEGEHQITHQLRNDRVLRTAENIYLYIKHVVTWRQRVRHFKRLLAISSGVEGHELSELRQHALMRAHGLDVSTALMLSRPMVWRRKIMNYLRP